MQGIREQGGLSLFTMTKLIENQYVIIVKTITRSVGIAQNNTNNSTVTVLKLS